MFELRLLGPTHLGDDAGEPVQDILRRPKRLAVLAYLAVKSADGLSRRDSILPVFWPERGQRRARNALNQSLHVLRRALGADVVLSRGSEEVGLDPARLWCDAVAFRREIHVGRAPEALELYRGEFLDGWHLSGTPEFERWIDGVRDRLSREALDAALRLSSVAEADGDLDATLRWARWCHSRFPIDERALRRWMEALSWAGDRPAALEAYESFAHRLSEEMELTPSTETRQLAAELRAVAPRTAPPIGSEHATVEGSPPLESSINFAARTRRRPGPDSPGVLAGAGARVFHLRWTASGLAAAAVLVLLAWRLIAGSSGPPFAVIGAPDRNEARRSYLVLPFAVATDDPSLEWLADGGANLLTLGLENWREIRVTGQRNVEALAERRGIDLARPLSLPEARELARLAGAGTVVLGEATANAGRLQVVVRLYDTHTGRRLGETLEESAPADGDLGRLFEHFASRILGLGGTIGVEPDLSHRVTRSLEAYREYLLGLRHLRRWEMGDAARHFRAALETDSTFALAHYRLALTLDWQGRTADRRREAKAEIGAAARYAENLPWREREQILAYRAVQQGDYITGRQMYRELLAVDSTDAEAWFQLGDLEYRNRALVPDEDGWLRPARDLNVARRGFQKAIELDPGFHPAYGRLLDLLQPDVESFSFPLGFGRLGRSVSPAQQAYIDTAVMFNEDTTLTVPELVFCVARAGDSLHWLARKAGTDPCSAGRSPETTRILRDSAIEMADRWVAHAPDEAQPLMQLRDLLLEKRRASNAPLSRELTTRLLEVQERLMEFPDRRSSHELALQSALLLAAGFPDSAASVARRAVADAGEEGKRFGGSAASVFAATGRLGMALRWAGFGDVLARNVGGRGYRSVTFRGSDLAVEDSLEILSELDVGHPRSLELSNSLEAILDTVPRPNEVARVLVGGSPALLEVLASSSPEALRRWEARFDSIPSEWRPFLLLRAGQAEEASRSLRQSARDELADTGAPASASAYLLARAAQELGEDSLATELYYRLDRHVARIDGFDSFWGLRTLTYLYRAQSYERLSDTTDAVRYYREFLRYWRNADPGLQRSNDEARAGLVRLGRPDTVPVRTEPSRG